LVVIGAANTAAPFYSKYYHLCHFLPYFCTNTNGTTGKVAPHILVQETWQHQYIVRTLPVAPIGKETLTSRKFFLDSQIFFMSAASLS
jgi:hypothetical protein